MHGSIFFDKGKYYAFYATRLTDQSEHLDMAESLDGIHLEKVLPSTFYEPKPPYRRGPNRDPFVFGRDRDFQMIVTASLVNPVSPSLAGALELLSSRDLQDGKVDPAPFLVAGYAADPECSDLSSGEDGITSNSPITVWPTTVCRTADSAPGRSRRVMCLTARKPS